LDCGGKGTPRRRFVFDSQGKSGVAEYLAAAVQIIRMPAPRINDIVRERRGVSAETAMRLARYFGGDARSWLNLQAAYDLRVAEIANAKRIEREIAPATA
jgi:antitoxin HigA-1